MKTKSTILKIVTPMPARIVAGILYSTIILTCCKSKEAVEEPLPISVNILTIDTLSESCMRTYVGEVQPNETIALSFSSGGKVERVMVHCGDAVRANQPIVTINKSTALNAYNSAKAQLDQAHDAYNRLKKVYEQGSLPEVKWVEILTDLEKAKSLEQIARKQMEDCALVAPCAGVIGECHAIAGGTLLPGETAVTLLDVRRIAVTFTVPESEIATVNEGDEVYIEVPALNNYIVTGKISERSMNASRLSHSYDVKVLLSNDNQRLRPGMVCKATMKTSDKSGIIVPAKSVQIRPEGESVWVIHNGHAELRTVEASEFVANGVLITAGLHTGDTIVTAGMQKLYPSAKVTIVR